MLPHQAERAALRRRLRRHVLLLGGVSSTSTSSARWRRLPARSLQRWAYAYDLPDVDRLPDIAATLGVSVHLLITGRINARPLPAEILARAEAVQWGRGQRACVRARWVASIRYCGGPMALARRTGVHRRTWEYIMTGRKVRCATLVAFVVATDVCADWLLGGPPPGPQLGLPLWDD